MKEIEPTHEIVSMIDDIFLSDRIRDMNTVINILKLLFPRIYIGNQIKSWSLKNYKDFVSIHPRCIVFKHIYYGFLEEVRTKFHYLVGIDIFMEKQTIVNGDIFCTKHKKDIRKTIIEIITLELNNSSKTINYFEYKLEECFFRYLL